MSSFDKMHFLFVFLFSWSLTAALSRQSTEPDELRGTWTSKSNTVVTGPSFYDPIDELLIEPALPGISFSFDGYGHWEQAIYQVQSNPENHSCTTASLLFQHGSYKIKPDGSMTLKPISVDGRQLFSDPCHDGGVSTYGRYNQMIQMMGHLIEVDSYRGLKRIQLFEWDGSKMQPLYLRYDPPMMLPVTVLNPINKKQVSKYGTVDKAKRYLINRSKTLAKRDLEWDEYFWVHNLEIVGSMAILAFGVFCLYVIRS